MMISVLKNRLHVGAPPPLPNGSTKGGTQCAETEGGLHPPPIENIGKRSPSRTRKRAIDQTPYQESVAARELRIFYNRNKLCNSFKKVLSSSAGLFIVLLLYICLGAFLFENIEGENEVREREQLLQQRREVTAKIADCYHNDTVDLEVCIESHVKNWEKVVVRKFHVSVFYAETWTFANSFYFCFTTISTIGYGTITPHTSHGRVICVFYAIVGIPLMLLFIADVGTALARWAKICAIAIKQRRKNSRTFKEAAKASWRKHLKPHRNHNAEEEEEEEEEQATNFDETTVQVPEPTLVERTPTPSPADQNHQFCPREFWVKMHEQKKRSLSMTTEHGQQSIDQEDSSDDATKDNDDSEDSDESSSESSGSKSNEDEESVETLKMMDCSSIVVQIDSDSDPQRCRSTDDDCYDQNGNRTEVVYHLGTDDSLESPTEVLVNPGACLDSPEDLDSKPIETASDNTPNTSDTVPRMTQQTSRVNFSDVIDLQSGKRTSLEEHNMRPDASPEEESSKFNGRIIQNPLVNETDEESESDKLLKPTGFRFNTAPRRNAVFIPGSDTSPSDPPTSPDTRLGQGGASSRRRSSITRKMGMAFGSITAVSDRDVAHFSFPAWLALLLLIIYILFGAGIVSMFEGWHFIDSFYFSFVSLSTIGFGDIIPVQSEAFTFLYTFLGLCFTSMCMSLSSKELTRLLKKLAWKVGYYKSRQWKGSVRAFVKDKKRRIHERSEHWRGSRRQKNRKRKRSSPGHRSGERSSLKSTTSPSAEQAHNHIGVDNGT